MKVSDVMTRDVELVSPDDTTQTAARIMKDIGAGALPLGENDRLVGMITDRDIAVRAVAEGMAPDRTKARDVMTPEVRYVFEDEDVAGVAGKMGEWQVRRLPVLNRDKRLVGIVSLGDLAIGAQGRVGEAVEGIVRPTGQHEQGEMAFSGNKPRR
jgi:CBS domain-containing protein